MKTTCLTMVVNMQSINTLAQPGYMSQYRFNLLFENAFEHMLSGEWNNALPLFTELYRNDTANANICYLTGFCLYKMRQEPALAVQLLKRATNSISLNYEKGFSGECKAPVITFYYLGEMQFMEGDFQASLTSYLKYLRFIPHWQKDTQHEVELMIATVEASINDRNDLQKKIALGK